MILTKLFTRITSGHHTKKIRPGGVGVAASAHQQESNQQNHAIIANKGSVTKKRQARPEEDEDEDDRGSSLSTLARSSLPTIVEEETHSVLDSPKLKQQNKTEEDEDDNDADLSTLSKSTPPRYVGEVCALLKGMCPELDAVLAGYEKVEEVIWSSLLVDGVCECKIQYHALDPSTLPPPDIRYVETVEPVEALLRSMVKTKDCERQFRRIFESSTVCSQALQRIETYKGNEYTKDLIRSSLTLLADRTSRESVFDEQIALRLSSVIRFHLRLALNGRKRFCPIVLSKQAKHSYDAAIPNGDVLDIPHPELNVAALLHQALTMVADGLPENAEVQVALKHRSAKKFISNVLACAKRIENVDDKRKTSWRAAQRWAGEAARLFEDSAERELEDLALLANLPDLEHRLVETHARTELTLLESHRAGLKDKRASGAKNELRNARTAVTGLCGRNGCFPDVVFILDA